MRTLFVALTLVLSASVADAQVRQDLIELGGSGSLQYSDGDAIFILRPSVGYFLTDRFEIGLNPVIVAGFGDESVFLTAFGALHFPSDPTARTVPFVGVDLGLSLTDGSGLALGAQGGIKQFFLPGGALTAAAFVDTNDGFDPVILGVQAGVSIFIGR
jgi:hypothetical protein